MHRRIDKTRIEACTTQLRNSETLNAKNVQEVKNIDGKLLNTSIVFNYHKEYNKRRDNKYVCDH